MYPMDSAGKKALNMAKRFLSPGQVEPKKRVHQRTYVSVESPSLLYKQFTQSCTAQCRLFQYVFLLYCCLRFRVSLMFLRLNMFVDSSNSHRGARSLRESIQSAHLEVGELSPNLAKPQKEVWQLKQKQFAGKRAVRRRQILSFFASLCRGQKRKASAKDLAVREDALKEFQELLARNCLRRRPKTHCVNTFKTHWTTE